MMKYTHTYITHTHTQCPHTTHTPAHTHAHEYTYPPPHHTQTHKYTYPLPPTHPPPPPPPPHTHVLHQTTQITSSWLITWCVDDGQHSHAWLTRWCDSACVTNRNIKAWCNRPAVVEPPSLKAALSLASPSIVVGRIPSSLVTCTSNSIKSTPLHSSLVRSSPVQSSPFLNSPVQSRIVTHNVWFSPASPLQSTQDQSSPLKSQKYSQSETERDPKALVQNDTRESVSTQKTSHKYIKDLNHLQ